VNSKLDFYFVFEGILCAYFAWSLFFVIQNKIFGSIPFLAMLLYGYLAVFGYGVYHRFFNEK
jgi:hypothetical protein